MQYEITTTSRFTNWIKTLKDQMARKAILKCIDRIAAGTFGEYKIVGNGVSEIKVRLGKGYRVYYTIKDQKVVVLLCGGDKSTQNKDIALAKQSKAGL
jgi:putative addiction module killer protein